jgi:Amidohydrolase family
MDWRRTSLVLLVFLLPLIQRTAGATLACDCTAIVDVTVVPMDTERSLSHQSVLVRNGRIAELGGVVEVKVPRDCAVIDGRHRYLIPGLVDTHVHFPLVGEKDQRLVLHLLLANGITTGINMEGSPEIVALRGEVARGEVLGPHLYTTGRFIQQPEFMTAEQVKKEIITEKQIGYDFIKVHGELTQDAYDAVFAAAQEQNLRVVGHVPSNLGIEAALRHHQVLIVHAEEFLYSYFQFHRQLPSDPAEIDSMVRDLSKRVAEAGTWVSPTLSVFRQIIFEATDLDAVLQRPEMRYFPRHLTTGAAVGAANFDWYPPNNPYVKRWPPERIPYLRAQYSIMQRLVRGLRDAGVPLLAGTDPFVPCVIPGFALKEELEQLYEAGLSPFEVLQTATTNAARFLGTAADSGTITSGKIADLVLLDANPLDDVDNNFRQSGVMLRGRWFSEDELQTELSKSAEADKTARDLQ